MPSRFEEVGAPLEERLGNSLLYLAYYTLSFGEQLHEDAMLCLQNDTTVKRASDAVWHAAQPSRMPYWFACSTVLVWVIRRVYIHKHASRMLDGHSMLGASEDAHEKTS